MSSNKDGNAPVEVPDNMATRMLAIHELAYMIADQCDLEAGKYALVVEYKLGNSILESDAEDGTTAPFPAMSIGIGGIGLQKTASAGKLIIDWPGKGKRKTAKKATAA